MPDASQQPDQIPVAHAFSVADRNTHPFLQRALDLIGQVHTDGSLPLVVFQHLPHIADGEYRPTIPPQILIDIGARDKLSTVIHEIAHVIDQFGIGDGIYGQLESSNLRDAAYSGPLGGWWRETLATSTVATLLSSLEDPTQLTVTINGYEVTPDEVDLEYLIAPEELWARAYLQYITVKTQDTGLISELQSTLSKRTYTRLEQWPLYEFRLIEAQIDVLFRNLGWRD